MMGDPLYPEGFNPAICKRFLAPHKQGKAPRFAKELRRIHADPVKYYFIDFGLSVRFSKGPNDPPRFYTFDGKERNPPEYKLQSFNPYILDIYILGKVYQRKLLQVGQELHFK